MAVADAQERITTTVLQWEGVTAHPHRFGGTEYRLARRELGHLHGNHLLDIPFPTKVRDEVVAQGQAQAHHLMPETGWISFYLRHVADVDHAIVLLRKSYDLVRQQRQPRGSEIES
jgi:hypothetical protein